MAKDDPKFKIENNILKGIEISCETENSSLGKFVLDILECSANFVGQVDAVTGEEYTYEKMRERSVRCALWMRSQGLLPGDVVAICSHNQLDLPMPCYASLYLGVAVTIWDDGLRKRELCHLLNVMKPKIAFVTSKSAAAVAEAAREASLDPKMIVFDRVPGFLDFESAIAEPRAEEVKNFRCADIASLDEIALIMCSSGTTGLPKGIALSHGSFLRQVHRAKNIRVIGYDWILFTAISWMSGTSSLFLYLSMGVTRIVPPPIDEYSICALIEKYKPRMILLASGMVNRLLKSDALRKYDLSSLIQVMYGGSSLAVSSQEAFAKVVPNAHLSGGYGLTEIGGGVSVQTKNSKSGSSGRIVENSQLKVIDPSTGSTLGPNQRGELLMKTACQMNFYYNNPEATAETVDEEGWVHSGDLGYYDEDGEIFVLERLKELIKYRGSHVSPFQLETVILSHPGVKEVVVVGVPHPVDDEHPVAFVSRVTDSTGAGKQVTEAELVDLVAAELSDSKRLRGGVRFLDHLPKTPSDKMRRKELRDLAKSMATIQGDRQDNS